MKDPTELGIRLRYELRRDKSLNFKPDYKIAPLQRAGELAGE